MTRLAQSSRLGGRRSVGTTTSGRARSGLDHNDSSPPSSCTCSAFNLTPSHDDSSPPSRHTRSASNRALSRDNSSLQSGTTFSCTHPVRLSSPRPTSCFTHSVGLTPPQPGTLAQGDGSARKKKARRTKISEGEKVLRRIQYRIKKIDPQTVNITAVDFEDNTFRMISNTVLNAFIDKRWPNLTPSSLPQEEHPGRLRIYTHPNMLKRNPTMPRLLVLRLDNVISDSAQEVYIRLFDVMRPLLKFPHLSVDANRTQMGGAIHCATGGVQSEEGVVEMDAFIGRLQNDLVPCVLGAMKMEDPEMYARMIHARKFVHATIRRCFSRKQYLETRCCLDFKGAFLCIAIKEGSSEVFHLNWQDDPNSLAWIAPLGKGWVGGDFYLPQLNMRIPIHPGQVLGAQTRRLIHCGSPVKNGRRIVVTCFSDRGTLKKADEWEEEVVYDKGISINVK
ncbi:hypothetical protein VKT23_010083 [Stygiomarasmius scandens]|uniref:Prolyl 4-hydroxylase alpha subunit domain-containing protein n=1 Tax=Marasmiellus scandens TaxID=2682957 RepID=A0ABR1JH34_9AGAR